MAKTNPGIDRITYQAAQQSAILGEKILAGHMKLCDQCSKSGGNVMARCAFWWKTAKAVHNLRRTLRQWEYAPGYEQPTLPGMEEL